MIGALPENLPSVATARLPAAYEAAKSALAECARIDECKDWADKMAAMASYAKQAKDDGLHKMAIRIQARAIRRCGELLQAIMPAKNQYENARGSGPPSRTQAAEDAGLSRDQRRTALRVAAIAPEEFNRAVESDDPPTLSDLAERGTQKREPLIDLGGRDPDDYRAATMAMGEVRQMFEMTLEYPVDMVLRGLGPRDKIARFREQAEAAREWLNLLLERLPNHE